MAMAEADGDGRLDLYIANYRTSTIQDAPGTRFSMKMINNRPEVVSINGRPLTDPEWTNRFKMKTEIDEQGRGRFMREELGEPDLFCKNMGNGRFEPVPWTSGRFLDEDGKPLAGVTVSLDRLVIRSPFVILTATAPRTFMSAMILGARTAFG